MTITPTPPPGCYNPITNAYTDAAIETITAPYSTGYEIRPNQIFVFPVTIGVYERVIFDVMHTLRHREDFTLGCWFSTLPNVPVLFYKDHTYIDSLYRYGRGFCLQDINYTGSLGVPPAIVRTHLVEPGTYYFNVQNRINRTNKFEFAFNSTSLV